MLKIAMDDDTAIYKYPLHYDKIDEANKFY
jgi:hypothetical protein